RPVRACRFGTAASQAPCPARLALVRSTNRGTAVIQQVIASDWSEFVVILPSFPFLGKLNNYRAAPKGLPLAPHDATGSPDELPSASITIVVGGPPGVRIIDSLGRSGGAGVGVVGGSALVAGSGVRVVRILPGGAGARVRVVTRCRTAAGARVRVV